MKLSGVISTNVCLKGPLALALLIRRSTGPSSSQMRWKAAATWTEQQALIRWRQATHTKPIVLTASVDRQSKAMLRNAAKNRPEVFGGMGNVFRYADPRKS